MDTSGRTLPMAVLIVVTGLLAVAIGVVMWRANSRSERFIIFAAWFRYVLSAFHTFTYRPLAAGLSGQAVGSIAILGLGLLTIDLRNLLQRFFAPCFAMVALIVLSGLVNGQISGIMVAATKWGYFLIVAVSLYEALGKSREGQVFRRLIWAFAPLLVFQALSVALGVVKAGESDGSASYIGGYYHEALFSVALATCLLTACLGAALPGLVRHGLIFACLIGIYLANYRTTIIAVAPLLLTYVAWPELKQLAPEQRPLLRFGAMMVGIVILGVAVLLLESRMADLGTVFSNLGGIIHRPETFTNEEEDLLSGRALIWSTFIYAYIDATAVQHVVGLGPESWDGLFGTYPHNTLVAYLYELGWVGVIAVVWLWGAMFVQAWRVRTSARVRLVAGHASFILLNLATMPHWLVEGNIFYGILCGYTLYHSRLTEAIAARRSAEAGVGDDIVLPAAV